MDNQRTLEEHAVPVAVLTLRTVKPGSEERFGAELHDVIVRTLLLVRILSPWLQQGSKNVG